jgi:hypothetical protein
MRIIRFRDSNALPGFLRGKDGVHYSLASVGRDGIPSDDVFHVVARYVEVLDHLGLDLRL